MTNFMMSYSGLFLANQINKTLSCTVNLSETSTAFLYKSQAIRLSHQDKGSTLLTSLANPAD